MTKATPIWLNKYRRLFWMELISWGIAIAGDTVDTVLAGRCLGDEAVAAVELVYPLLNVSLFLCGFLTIGISTLYAQALGAGEKENAYRAAGMGLWLSAASSAVFGGVLAGCKNAFFAVYSGGETVDAMARGYYDGFVAVSVLYPVYWLVYYLVTMDGDLGTVLLADAVNVAGNVGCSLLFVRQWGVAGIGFGTAAGLLLSGAVLLLHFAKKSCAVRFRFGFRWDWLRQSLGIGAATSMSSLYMGVTDLVLNKVVLDRFGEEYLAVYAAVNLVLNISLCFMCGISAASPLLAAAWGEENTSGMRRVMRYASLATLGLATAGAAVLELAAGAVPALYELTEGSAAEAVYAVRVLCLSYPAAALVSELVGCYSRIRREWLANAVSAAHMLVLPLAFGCLFAGLWGFRGLVWGLFAASAVTLAGLLAYVRLRYGREAVPFLIPVREGVYTEDAVLDPRQGQAEAEAERVCRALRERLAGAWFAPAAESVPGVRGTVMRLFAALPERNAGRRVKAECTVGADGDRLTLTVRTDGETECVPCLPEAAEAAGLPVLSAEYDVITGWNRYRIVWLLRKAEKKAEQNG